MKKAGFDVATAADGSGALALAVERPREVVITEAGLGDMTGFDLCRRLRSTPSTASTSVMFLTEDRSPDAKIEAISAGADEYLSKPVRVKEIVARVVAMLERRELDAIADQNAQRNFSGTLDDIGLVDLLQLIETGRKTCVLHVATTAEQSGGFVAKEEERARVYCRDGQVIDAEVGPVHGREGLYRLLLWNDGVFEMEFTQLGREDVVNTTTQALLIEGMRRLDEWSVLQPRLPDLHALFDVDYKALGRVGDLPEMVEAVVRLFDGQRTVLDVVNDSEFDDVASLSVVARLFDDGILYDRRTRPPKKVNQPADLDRWLSGAQPPATARAVVSEPLPSALEKAVIPSPVTPSQILDAVDRSSIALPQPLPVEEPITPASRADALNQPVGQPEPRLVVKRVPSVIAPAPMRQETGTFRVWPTQAPAEAEQTWSASAAPPSDWPTQHLPDQPSVAPPPFDDPSSARATMTDGLASGAPSRVRRGPRTPDYRGRGLGQDTEIMPPPVAAAPATEPRSVPPPVAERRSVPPPVAAAPVPAPKTQPPPPPPPTVGGLPAISLDPPTPEPQAVSWSPEPHTVPPPPAAPQPTVGERTEERFFDRGDHHVDPPQQRQDNTKLWAAAIFAAFVVAALWIVMGRGERQQPAPIAAAPAAEQKARKPIVGWESPTIETKPAPPPTTIEPVEVSATPEAAEPAPPPLVAPPPAAAPPPPAAKPAAAAAPPPPPPAAKPKPAPKPVAKPKPAPKPVAKPKPRPAPRPVAKPKPKPKPKGPDPKVIAALVKSGDSALAKENLSKARSDFGKALKLDRKNAQARSGLAMALFMSEKYPQAKREAKRALASSSRDARAHLVLGYSANLDGDNVSARKHYERFLQLAPRHAQATEIRQLLASLE